MMKDVSDPFRAEDYDDLLASRDWQSNLSELNEYLVDSLADFGVPAVLNGNLF